MSDADNARETAITQAAGLVEFFMAERKKFAAQGFAQKAATAMARAHDARKLMEALIRERSPAMVARMEWQRRLDTPACANEERGA